MQTFLTRTSIKMLKIPHSCTQVSLHYYVTCGWQEDHAFNYSRIQNGRNAETQLKGTFVISLISLTLSYSGYILNLLYHVKTLFGSSKSMCKSIWYSFFTWTHIIFLVNRSLLEKVLSQLNWAGDNALAHACYHGRPKAVQGNILSALLKRWQGIHHLSHILTDGRVI